MSDVPAGHEDLTLGRLRAGSVDRVSTGWWGMIALVGTEAALFGYLLFAYYYNAVEFGRAWLPDKLLGFAWSAPETACLVIGCVVIWWGERSMRKSGSRLRLGIALLLAWCLAAGFVFLQLAEWAGHNFTLWSSSYGSIYYTVTGFDMAHVIAGIAILTTVSVWNLLGYFDRVRMTAVSGTSLYFYFVTTVWISIWLTFYVTPYIFDTP